LNYLKNKIGGKNMSNQIIGVCTDCPERCILTSEVHHCAKIGSKLWLDRSAIICRTCPNAAEVCPACTRVGNTEMGKDMKRDEIGVVLQWDIMSEMIWNDYLSRHPEFKPKPAHLQEA
jgi:hypothetical protein